MKHQLLERCCSFFKPMLKNFVLFRTRKLTNTCQRVLKTALSGHLHYMTRHSVDIKKEKTAILRQVKKTMHTSFQSEYVKSRN